MKKQFALLVVLVLAACQAATPDAAPVQETVAVPKIPGPSPTPVDTETLAGSDTLIKGLWYSADGILMQFGIRGTADLAVSLRSIAYERDPWSGIASGTADFENGKVTYQTYDGLCEDAQAATYEFFIVKHEEKMIGMRQKLVGEDTCAGRQTTTDGKFYKYLGQPTIFMPNKTQERLATSSTDLLGVWYSASNSMFMEFKGNSEPSTGSADLLQSSYLMGNAKPWDLFAEGPTKFESGRLTFLGGDASCSTAQATYEIYLILADEQVIAMKPRLIGEDGCVGREVTLDNKVVQRVTP